MWSPSPREDEDRIAMKQPALERPREGGDGPGILSIP